MSINSSNATRKMFRSVVCNLLASIVIQYSYCQEEQLLIWIQHTDVLEQYLSVREAAEMLYTSSSSISHLSAAERFRLCQADFITFKNMTAKMKDLKLDDIPVVENDVKEKWKSKPHILSPVPESNSNNSSSPQQSVGSFSPGEADWQAFSDPMEKLSALLLYTAEYAVILAAISPQLVQKMNVLMCSIASPHLFIADGYLRDTFYRIESNPADEAFVITGLLEPIPLIDEELLNDNLQLQISFLEEYRRAERVRKKKSPCKLNNFTKFRMCSSVYISWTLHNNGQLLWHNFMVDHDVCIRDITIQMPLITLPLTESLAVVDLIPCAINKESSEPQFYLASNQCQDDSAYVIYSKTNRTANDEEYKEYFLDLHVRNIASLH